MSELKSEIAAALQSRRTLTESTTKTYVSLLSSLAKKLDGQDVDFFSKSKDKILTHVDSLEKASTRKTVLSALYVLTGISEYSDSMRANMRTVTAEYATQKLTPGRAETRMTFDEVKAVHEFWMAKYKRVANEENTVNVLITGLMSGYYGPECPPRRVLDFSSMKIRNYDKANDNFMSGTTMTFLGKYKTAASERARGIIPTLVVPVPLRAVVKKWKILNPGSDYLLLNTKNKPFTANALNKRLTVLYGFGCDQLRSIFISSVMAPDLDVVKKANDVAEKMSHSVAAAESFYRK